MADMCLIPLLSGFAGAPAAGAPALRNPTTSSNTSERAKQLTQRLQASPLCHATTISTHQRNASRTESASLVLRPSCLLWASQSRCSERDMRYSRPSAQRRHLSISDSRLSMSTSSSDIMQLVRAR